MKFTPVDPPREFRVGRGRHITLRDTGRVELDPDEQVTFITESGAEYDVARKSWGYYATPSLNGRLKSFGLRGALIRGADGKGFIFLVESGKEDDFRSYLESEELILVSWLDRDEDLAALQAKAAQG